MYVYMYTHTRFRETTTHTKNDEATLLVMHFESHRRYESSAAYQVLLKQNLTHIHIYIYIQKQIVIGVSIHIGFRICFAILVNEETAHG